MRAMQTHMIIISFMFVIFVASSTRAQKSNHTHNNKHALSIAIDEMEKANYFSFVMLINMLPSTNPKLLANITFLMPRDRALSKSNTIHQDSVSEFLLRHSIPSPLTFDHLNLIPNGSVIPSSLPHYTFKISNGGRSNYLLNNVKIVSRDICNLGSIKCHGIDSILQSSSSTIEDNAPQNNHKDLPNISCPSSHNNNSDGHNSSQTSSDHNDHQNSSPPGPGPIPIPIPTPTPTPTALPPSSRPKSDSFSIRDGGISTLLVICILGLLLSGIGM